MIEKIKIFIAALRLHLQRSKSALDSQKVLSMYLGARKLSLGVPDKHPAYLKDRNLDMCLYAMMEI